MGPILMFWVPPEVVDGLKSQTLGTVCEVTLKVQLVDQGTEHAVAVVHYVLDLMTTLLSDGFHRFKTLFTIIMKAA